MRGQILPGACLMETIAVLKTNRCPSAEAAFAEEKVKQCRVSIPRKNQ